MEQERACRGNKLFQDSRESRRLGSTVDYAAARKAANPVGLCQPASRLLGAEHQ